MPILPPQPGVISATVGIAIFHPVTGLVYGARSCIDAKNILRADLTHEFYILVCPYLIAIDLVPGQFQTGRPFVLRADAILPVIPRYHIASRITDIGDL